MKLKVLIVAVLVVTVAGVILWEVVYSLNNKGTELAEYKRAYLTDRTIWLKDFSDSQGIDTAISETMKVSGSNIRFVKIKHVNDGGSGGYMTAITEVEDFKPGDSVVLKELKTKNANAFEFSIIIAERAPTPRGH